VFQAVAAWWAASAAKTKLDGIASGATANSSDATLLARANHTGTQGAGTITGLAAVATSGAYVDLSGRPTLGTAAATASTDYAAAIHGHSWSQIGSTPTTLSGYGITMATARLLGRSTAGTGAPEEFALLGLAFNGTNLATLADLVIPLADETSLITTSTRLTIPYWPRLTVLTDVPIWAVATAPTGVAMEFDIRVGSTTIFTATRPTIATGVTNSTAATGSVAGTFSTAFTSAGSSIAAGAVVTFLLTQQATSGGFGLKVALFTRRAG
jgi:hypothetical protein